MNTSPSDHRPPSGFQWYSHPLTSLIAVAALATLLTIPFDTTTAEVTLAAMLAFMTACRDAYNRSGNNTHDD
jgi:hypothetical protein